MKDYLISMFIDDELDLDNKIDFVETIYDNCPFKAETVDLLRQEKTICSKVVDHVPPLRVQPREKKVFPPASNRYLCLRAGRCIVDIFATGAHKTGIACRSQICYLSARGQTGRNYRRFYQLESGSDEQGRQQRVLGDNL